MVEKKKAKVAVGVFAGILDEEGKLLLKRRIEETSIIPGTSFKGNWELPGGGILETEEEKVPYHYLLKELSRELDEEVGMQISSTVDPIRAMYPVFFKGPEGYDLAMVTTFQTSMFPTRGEIIWVSPQELEKLAREFAPANKKEGKDGKGLVSGYGKRMHCMALKALCFSPNSGFAKEAERVLKEIQSTWL